jgi:hypothetical protein
MFRINEYLFDRLLLKAYLRQKVFLMDDKFWPDSFFIFSLLIFLLDVDCHEYTNNLKSHFSYNYINILHQLSIQKTPFLYDHLYQILFLNEQRDHEESFSMQLIPILISN